MLAASDSKARLRGQQLFPPVGVVALGRPLGALEPQRLLKMHGRDPGREGE